MSDERFLVAGHGAAPSVSIALVQRRYADGGLDPSLNDSGTVEFEDPETPDKFRYVFESLALQSDGRILVGGRWHEQGPILLRLWD